MKRGILLLRESLGKAPTEQANSIIQVGLSQVRHIGKAT